MIGFFQQGEISKALHQPEQHLPDGGLSERLKFGFTHVWANKHPFRPSGAAPPCPFLQAGGDAQRRADCREDGHQRLDDHFPN